MPTAIHGTREREGAMTNWLTSWRATRVATRSIETGWMDMLTMKGVTDRVWARMGGDTRGDGSQLLVRLVSVTSFVVTAMRSSEMCYRWILITAAYDASAKPA